MCTLALLGCSGPVPLVFIALFIFSIYYYFNFLSSQLLWGYELSFLYKTYSFYCASTPPLCRSILSNFADAINTFFAPGQGRNGWIWESEARITLLISIPVLEGIRPRHKLEGISFNNLWPTNSLLLVFIPNKNECLTNHRFSLSSCLHLNLCSVQMVKDPTQ